MKLLLTALLLYVPCANALVDMKNATFSDYWVDLLVPGTGYELRIDRNYSSRSLFSGIFGFGWCSNLEANLEITLEGNLLLTECGGAAVPFYPANYNTQLINDSVERIVKMIKQKDTSKTKKQIDELREQMRGDHRLRTQMAGEVGFKIAPIKNTVFLAYGRDIEKIMYDGANYVRNISDGGQQKFDQTGRLIMLADRSKNFLKISYADNLPSVVVDNQNRKLNFHYYMPEKKLKQITGTNGLNVRYKFSGENLVSVTNAWNNTFNYSYDSNHNLTKMNFPDGTFKTIAYVESKDWVNEFRDRNGCVETFSFTLSAENPKDNFSSASVKTCNGKVVNRSKYEFWHQMRPDKEKYLSRVLTEKNNQITDISYHQDFPKPISVRKNSDLTTLQYSPNGLLKQKTVSLFLPQSDDNQKYTTAFSYDGNNRIYETSTEYFNKSGKNTKKKKTTFKYDSAGRLIAARAGDGQFVEIKYNNFGLIVSVEDHTKKELVIEYDTKTLKPSAIIRPSVGSIQLSYSPTGELKKTQTKGGASASTQILAAFNNYVDMVGPISTELSVQL